MRLYNILMALIGTSETLATGATIYRNGKKRKLVLSNYVKTSSTFTLPSGDAPSEQLATIGLRTTSNNLGTALGNVTVRTTGVIDFYYAPNYNNASAGLTGLATGDKMTAVAEWIVGGG